MSGFPAIAARRGRWSGLIVAALLAGCVAQPLNAPKGTEAPGVAMPQPPPPAAIDIPVDYYTLDNGLKVVLSRDATAPTVTVGVYYHIGFRIEPRGRTGFAHLFEHLMFQGSANLGKMEFIRLIEGNGGILNGSTRFDYTNYYQIVPANVLETVLWAEADRMKGLAITQANLANQQGVVKNEVRDATMNQPYGGFPWLTMPQVANQNWFNAHNFYGDLDDLDAATLDDAKSFFDTYYAPDNAVVVVAGDFDPAAARAWVAKYFGPIPSRAQPPRPDLTEPVRTAEKRDSYVDRLAPRPALALAWQVPPRNTPEHYAFSLLDTILLQGEDSRLWQKLVQERGYSDSVSGGTNLLGNEFTYDGPMLWMLYLIHDPGVAPDAIIADVDAEIARLQAEPPTREELDRALTKLRASLYDLVGSSTRFGLVDLLASFALFDGDPARINRLEAEFRAVTPEQIQSVARTWLAPERRTVQIVEPGRAAPPQAKGGQP
jgi:predicted Zn-dependent peptidase